jgi:hypothetical protein
LTPGEPDVSTQFLGHCHPSYLLVQSVDGLYPPSTSNHHEQPNWTQDQSSAYQCFPEKEEKENSYEQFYLSSA